MGVRQRTLLWRWPRPSQLLLLQLLQHLLPDPFRLHLPQQLSGSGLARKRRPTCSPRVLVCGDRKRARQTGLLAHFEVNGTQTAVAAQAAVAQASAAQVTAV